MASGAKNYNMLSFQQTTSTLDDPRERGFKNIVENKTKNKKMCLWNTYVSNTPIWPPYLTLTFADDLDLVPDVYRWDVPSYQIWALQLN